MIASDHLLSWINKIILVDLGYGQVLTGRLINIRGMNSCSKDVMDHDWQLTGWRPS